MVDVVDEHDRVVEARTLAECLRRGLLHRAVAVLVVRSDGRALLQRRSRKDRWHPGLLTLSSTGHVRSGEAYAEAAKRELDEELGIVTPLTSERRYLIPAMESGGLVEREWVAFYTAVSDAPVRIDPEEVDSTEEVTPQALRAILDGGDITPDAVVILRDHLHLGGLPPPSSV